ncbi:MAG: sporulation membrane protein YtaF [Firmicutes bacterium]|nr:sporulation membrane protein YtaF [Bacillota bacterium]
MSLGIPLLLALAVSMDGFSAGLTCGMRLLAIPFPSLLVICSSSAAAIACSMLIGGRLACCLPVELIGKAGGLLLFFLGIYVIGQNLRLLLRRESEPEEAPPRGALRQLSAVIKKPERADLDRSGILSLNEALLLGAALAADAFGAGFAAALIGAPLLPTVAAVGLTKLILVPLGAICGRYLARKFSPEKTALLGGFILSFIGIMTII